MIQSWINGENIDAELASILISFHNDGPIHSLSLEKLAYYKRYHSEKLLNYEKKLLHTMGLFYKISTASNMVEAVYSIFAQSIHAETGNNFTPVQASVYNSIRDNKYYSFSAPTSAGKSYLFREIIQETRGDTVIVVPSRALISEYFFEVISLVGKDVLVLQFIEDVNRDLVKRRIFIVTPERGLQLFKQKDSFNIELFLLDEAQLSEEEYRGMRFDAFVRRIDRIFPSAKKVFAHPFVSNPEAQLQKHNFSSNCAAYSYKQQTVGKIFLHYDNSKFTHFSPNVDCQEAELGVDIAEEVLSNNGTMLIYIAKSKIYDGSYRLQFGRYVQMCPKLENERALEIIKSLKTFIGAKEEGSDKHSNLIELMERGVVTHHGSMPLKARLIVERFIKEGWARICFATSTLNQGINMPFDVVWIDNFRNVKELTLKNLIGRAGRTSMQVDEFDYGFTIVKKENVQTFSSRFKETYSLRSTSLLDSDSDSVDEDMRDLVDAIKFDSFNDELHLPEVQVTRIENANIDRSIQFILDTLVFDGRPVTGRAYYNLPESDRTKVKKCFKAIYLVHLRREKLEAAESSVLSAAIPLMLWHIQGRSFSEIISLRHSFLTKKSEQSEIKALLKSKQIDDNEANMLWQNLYIRFSQVPSSLPNKGLTRKSSFPEDHISKLDYDSLVYDTYDYLDKVISLSLADPICASLEIYYKKYSDERAMSLSNCIRFGTSDTTEIWLLKYGFGFEDIEWIKEHVQSIDSKRIHFHETIFLLPADKMEIIERYV